MKEGLAQRLRHVTYTGAWKKCEPLWDLVIRSGALAATRPLLEAVLSGRSGRPAPEAARLPVRPGQAGEPA